MRRTSPYVQRAFILICVGLNALWLNAYEAGANPAVATAPPSARAPMGFHGICSRYSWVCKNSTTAKRRYNQKSLVSIASTVNSEVNRTITPRTDQQNYGVIERWTLPYNGAGDCEDFALLKMKRLIEAGVPQNRLLLANALLSRRETHLVLVVRTDQGDLVLDNRRKLVKWARDTGYRLRTIQNPADRRQWKVYQPRPSLTRIQSASASPGQAHRPAAAASSAIHLSTHSAAPPRAWEAYPLVRRHGK